MPDNTTTTEQTVDVTINPVKPGKFAAKAEGKLGGDSFKLEIEEGESKVKRPGEHGFWHRLFHPGDKPAEPAEYAPDANKPTSVHLTIDGKVYTARTGADHGGFTGVHAESDKLKKSGKKEDPVKAYIDGDEYVDRKGHVHKAHIQDQITDVNDDMARQLAALGPDVVEQVKKIMLPNGEKGAPGQVTSEQLGSIVKVFEDIGRSDVVAAQRDLGNHNLTNLHGANSGGRSGGRQ